MYQDWEYEYFGLDPKRFEPTKYLAMLIRSRPLTITTVIETGVEHNYRTSQIPKNDGGLRLIMVPSGDLKIIQTKLNQNLLSPYHHEACHGFAPGRSIISNAEIHLEATYLLALDLKDAFTSVTRERVHSALCGWPVGEEEIGWSLAELIAELGTTRIPGILWEPRLPQGAPSSPALFNLVCYLMDVKLTHFATLIGAKYTRYADNLAFSATRAFTNLETRTIRNIVEDKCGFEINKKKTRLMRVEEAKGALRLPGVRVRNGKLGLTKRQRRQYRGALHKAIKEGEFWKVWGLLSYLHQVFGEAIPEQILGINEFARTKEGVQAWQSKRMFRDAYGHGYQMPLIRKED